MAGSYKREKKSSEINIAPLLDMVFILLIFFVVTSNFVRETGVDVSKPQARSAQQLKKENILIGITREGTIHLHERQVDLSLLETIMKRLMLQDPDRDVVIVADRGTDAGVVVDVMDVCNIAGSKKVSIAAQKK